MELGTGAGSPKTRMMRLPGREKSLTSVLWIQYINVTDGQTDKDRAYAWRREVKTTTRIFMKILPEMYLWTREVSVKFWMSLKWGYRSRNFIGFLPM